MRLEYWKEGLDEEEEGGRTSATEVVSKSESSIRDPMFEKK